MTKILSFFNNKGGVAKSTSSVNVAYLLASEFKFKTLLIDCDAQGNASLNFGMYENEPNIKNVMVDEENIRNCIYKYDKIENLWILPSNIKHSVTEGRIAEAMNREMILSRALKEVKDEYDYIIIDCPPSLGLMNVNTLAASTHIFIPFKIGKYSLMGISNIYNTINQVKKYFNEDLTMAGIFITQDEPNTTVAKDIKNHLQEKLSSKTLETTISKAVKVIESEFHEKPIVLYDRENKISKEYYELTKEMIERVK